MPLLDYPAATELDPAKREAEGVLADLTALHQNSVARVTAIFARVWQNPSATPAQILAQLGPRAVPLFVLSAQFQDLLNAARPESIALVPPVAVEFHEDGTVTLPEVEPEA